MRLSFLTLLLAPGVAGFCQSAPPSVHTDPPSCLCERGPETLRGNDWSMFSNRGGVLVVPSPLMKLPPLNGSRGQTDRRFVVPFAPQIDPKFGVPFTAQVDPRFVVHPPQSSIGTLAPGRPVDPKVYPDLRLQLIRAATVGAEPGSK